MRIDYLKWDQKSRALYPNARWRKDPRLSDEHGIVLDVFDAEKDGEYILIVDYSFAIGRPDAHRFLQEPWLDKKAFSLDADSNQAEVEAIHCETPEERERVFSDLLHRLTIPPQYVPDSGFRLPPNMGDADDPFARVPIRPLPSGLVGGNALPLPTASVDADDETDFELR